MITSINEFKKYLKESSEQTSSQRFSDVYPKNTWVNISTTRQEFDTVLKNIIDNAYKNVPGASLEDPMITIHDPNVNHWHANDIDEDPDCDITLFGKQTNYGIKINGMGQDGTRLAKMELIKKLREDLDKQGFYIEITDNILNILDPDIQYINNAKDVEKILNKKIEWVGQVKGLDKEGWYFRDIHGHYKLKILVGKPNNISPNSLSESIDYVNKIYTLDEVRTHQKGFMSSDIIFGSEPNDTFQLIDLPINDVKANNKPASLTVNLNDWYEEGMDEDINIAEKLSKILHETGKLSPIVIDENNNIMDGLHRFVVYFESEKNTIPTFKRIK